MTTETPTMPEVTDDLGAFSKSFFNPDAEPATETATPEPEAEETVTETDTSEAEEAATETDDGDEDEAPKPKKRTTADRLKAKAAENAALRAEIAAIRAEIEAAKKPLTNDKPADNVETGLEKPDPTKFKYGELDPEYLEALADYRADLKIAKFQATLREQQEQERQQEAEKRASATLQETVTEIERLGASKFSDFHELVVEGGQAGEYALTREMFDTIAELPRDVAPDVFYYLASYPDESAKVAQMTPRQQALWFGRLEAEIKATASAPAPKKVTSAPPPPASIPKGSGSKGGPSLTDLNDPRALDAMTKALFG